jgi:hypothetical protein
MRSGLGPSADRYRELVNNLSEALPSAELSRARRIVAALVGSVTLQSTAGGGLVAEMAGYYPGLLNLVFDITQSGSHSAKAADRISSS